MSKNQRYKIATVLCLLILSGCSTIVVEEVTKEVPVLIPDSLVEHPCTVTGAGDSLEGLVKGYIKNTSCVGDYRTLVDKQKEWLEEVKTIYGVGNQD